MHIGTVIAENRKKLGMTQEALAQQLGVTNQAVSKWESEQSCPDIALLPRIADIFGITMDELFGREVPEKEPAETSGLIQVEPAAPVLPWEDDGVLRVVLYVGQTLVGDCPEQETITFEYEGPALNIECAVNVACSEVEGNVTAGGDVSCEDVQGHVHAGRDVSCDGVEGNVQADGNVTCDSVEGSVSAGGNVTCDSVEGNINAGGEVTCDSVEGNVYAGGNVTCDDIAGSVTAGGSIHCEGKDCSFSFGTNGEDRDKNEKKKGRFTFRF